MVHFKLDESPKKKPAIVALIDMDGTDCRMVHYLIRVKPEEVVVSMAVKPMLKAKKERKSHIEGFKPASLA
ncbi:MAG: hypothetical protein SWK76_14050 [Actinomycetota bacterium]|nr:hypothetical protein [Actinomycetota bacterium]